MSDNLLLAFYIFRCMPHYSIPVDILFSCALGSYSEKQQMLLLILYNQHLYATISSYGIKQNIGTKGARYLEESKLRHASKKMREKRSLRNILTTCKSFLSSKWNFVNKYLLAKSSAQVSCDQLVWWKVVVNAKKESNDNSKKTSTSF